MTPVSTKVQRILAFIPGLNLFCLPIFIYNLLLARITLKDYLRSLIYYAFPAVFLEVLREIISCCFPAISVIVGYICTYLASLIVGLRLVKFQERYL